MKGGAEEARGSGEGRGGASGGASGGAHSGLEPEAAGMDEDMMLFRR